MKLIAAGVAMWERSQVVRWAVVGSLNTALAIALIWVFVDQFGIAYPVAAVAIHIALISALYVVAGQVVFNRRERSLNGLAQFHLAYLGQLGVLLLGLWLLHDLARLPILLAEVVALGFAAALSFLAQRLVVFRPR